MATSCQYIRFMEVEPPVWVLDRRDSGPLFWRRDHPVVDKHVKFRCDVEVLEFWRSDEERQQMLGVNTSTNNNNNNNEDENDYSNRNNNFKNITSLLEFTGSGCRAGEEMPPPSSLAAAFCVCVIIATLSYNWLIAATA